MALTDAHQHAVANCLQHHTVYFTVAKTHLSANSVRRLIRREGFASIPAYQYHCGVRTVSQFCAETGYSHTLLTRARVACGQRPRTSHYYMSPSMYGRRQMSKRKFVPVRQIITAEEQLALLHVLKHAALLKRGGAPRLERCSRCGQSFTPGCRTCISRLSTRRCRARGTKR